MSLPIPAWMFDRCNCLGVKVVAIAIALLFLFAPCPASADSQVISVIYPEADGAYKKLFDKIIEGIMDETGVNKITRLPISAQADVEVVIEHLANTNPNAVITLGRHPYSLASALNLPKPLIVGALNIAPDTHPNVVGISLTPDPKLVFGRLKSLATNINRVAIVFDPDKEQWLAELATKQAVQFGLTVDLYAARNLSEASRHYLNIIRYGNPKSDAIWVTSNVALLNENTWPRLVEESWQRNFLLFSSTLTYADTGALFAVYPEPRGLGRRLAQMAKQHLANRAAHPEIEPLQNVNAAINMRVADHLGIWLDGDQKRSFDLILGDR